MTRSVVNLFEVDRNAVELVGGKGAHLGELSRIDGIRVPAGFCVTTAAFDRVLPTWSEEGVIAEISAAVRGDTAYAVRSSATAEDAAGASFAGQHDTYLNVIGAAAVLEHVRRCWASLFTERAVAYRLRHGVERDAVRMAVVVQEMVFPQASGVAFTADPVTGNRRVTSIEAGFGLGEALVSGLVNTDVYQVRDGAVIAETVGAKRLAVHATPGGGTAHHEIAPDRQGLPVLTTPEIVRLAALARRVEEHFGSPQDIEWCLDDDGFAIVQSRPITTLFPVPPAPDDRNRVYVSVGHQQMMTEAMRPLGLSVWKATSPGHMLDAGGRLFVDVTARLASPSARAALLPMMSRSDPLMGDAMQNVVDRKDFVPVQPEEPLVAPGGTPPAPIATDRAVVTELIAEREAALVTLKRDIAPLTGPELIDFVVADIGRIRQILFGPRNLQAIMAGIDGTWWLNEHLESWLGETNAADTLTQSAPDNVTSEMGMALLDVADAVRPYPEVVAFLRNLEGDDFLDRLPELPGGREARAVIEAYLERYGMRCVGEIDITRPRWSEHPAAIVPMILSNVRNAEPGARERRFEQGRQDALRKEREVLARLRSLPGDGAAKAAETKQVIDRVRTFIGYREYPKYNMIARYFVYKRALLAEAERLVAAGVLGDAEDIYFLTLEELQDLVRTQRADDRLIDERKAAFASFRILVPPRVLTSEGEAVTGAYRRADLPSGALAGLAVSAGVVEGRARVLHDLADADLAPGDILVTAYTDPSWTPAFVAVSGLVTEVGGQMTHGAVIAREYGLPAVVGVENATTLISDGQQIRVHGTDGYVELL
ncbi:rifamycin-inactivating phosphotransferase [Actinoplanes awajinensis]|uniref:Phosphoenolpyruvate synthase n=1 Tax=Actinoplanes awajinensis subsp. mycoplanecinus TaxID=135947 RepID=A0A0X3UNN0_9ACTN|nr:rifamycin-inactivating phosphotransferase [Actinoplanes awajinensis]KUL34218.1 phosphoenolpyruvate synthase [Actinoplanes awajinensis subsp. mycoplanecinus]